MDPSRKIKLILEKKRESIARLERETSLRQLTKEAEKVSSPRGFGRALKGGDSLSVIAEVKKASPSKGIIREDFSPVEIAREYESSGARAISVLTEEHFFLGSPEYLRAVRETVSIPVLRKDFLMDPIQIAEARALGADAVLLIVAFLEKDLLKSMITAAGDFGMDALVEVHEERELDIALELGAEIIGINNRNLKTFQVDLETTFRLIPAIGEGKTVVSESGISTHEQVVRLAQSGVEAILVGESLMRSAKIGEKLRFLIHGE